MKRDALPDVLAAITTETSVSWWDMMRFNETLSFTDECVMWKTVTGYCPLRSWLHDSPAEAIEALAHSGLWPMEWMDSACGVRWWCSFLNDAIIDTPPTVPDLAAVASLGVINLHRVVEFARVIEPDAVVVWRVMTLEAIQEHHRGCEERRNDSSAALVFSREARDDEWSGVRRVLRERDGRKRWQEKCPYHGWFGGGGDDDPQGVHRAWPALRELHAMGVHLVGHTPRMGDAPGHVVIGVEALP